MRKRKGVVLLVTLMVMSILLVLTGSYFVATMTEKRSTDAEGYFVQSLEFAEAGLAHARSELRERIETDLKIKATAITSSTEVLPYYTNNASLSFLRDYAYATGEPQFTLDGSQAYLHVTTLDLNATYSGFYNATINVTQNGAPAHPGNDSYIFYYAYSVESRGLVTENAPGVERKLKLIQGFFNVTIQKDNFAKFALFTSHHGSPSGDTVWFTADTSFSGPIHTNTRFSFANNPSSVFSSDVSQSQNSARFYNQGSPLLMDASSNPPYDVPVFNKTFTRGTNLINLPSAVSQQDLKDQALGTMGNPGPSGIYIPSSGGTLTGGVYVKGNQGLPGDNAYITMSTSANGPVYTITQSGATTTVTVDYAANQTTVQDASGNATYAGLPDGLSDEGLIIYVDDDIESISGTVNKDTKVTVAAERDIIVTNHILYEQYTPSPLSAEGFDNVMGIISWGGNVRVGTSAPNNLSIHSVVMAPTGVLTVDNYNAGAPRGIVTLLGGMITQFYGPFGTFSGSEQTSGYGRSFVYDSRMMKGVVPPYFPYMGVFTSYEEGLYDPMVWQDTGA